MTASLFVAGQTYADVYITEWMYSGNGGEFIEFTNLGDSAVDFTGWSYDDDSRVAGMFCLSGFGMVAPGESVVLTEDTSEKFRSDWGLDTSVKVIGGYTNNIGRADEINLYDSLNELVDRFAYGDSAFPGSIRTQGASGNPIDGSMLGANDPYGWVLSVVGDEYGSYLSANGDIGNPGTNPVVPIPGTIWLLGSAVVGLVGLKRRK